jgi:hypothetical protein
LLGSPTPRLARFIKGKLIRGEWSSPDARRVTVAEYAHEWVAERPLEPRTRELYESQLRNHIDPYLGAKTLDKLTPQAVRSWRQQLLNEGRSVTVAAKSYRLLRAVLNTSPHDYRRAGGRSAIGLRPYDAARLAPARVGRMASGPGGPIR